MKEIVCPVDFSTTSLNALEYATKITEVLRLKLVLLHIHMDEEKENINRLNALKDEIQKTSDILVFTEEINGNNVAKEIIDYAELHGASYIVMGTAGAHDIEEAFVGSTTVHVLENSSRNIVCIPRNASFNSIRTFVYATDYLPEDIRKIQLLCTKAESLGARVKVIHVTSKLTKQVSFKFDNFAENIQESVFYKKLSFELVHFKGDVEHGLDKYMDENDADMLALSSRHRTGLVQFFHSSVTKKLSYMVNYPIMVFKV